MPLSYTRTGLEFANVHARPVCVFPCLKIISPDANFAPAGLLPSWAEGWFELDRSNLYN